MKRDFDTVKIIRFFGGILGGVVSSMVLLFNLNYLYDYSFWNCQKLYGIGALRYDAWYWILTIVLLSFLYISFFRISSGINKSLLLISLLFGIVEIISLLFYYYYSIVDVIHNVNIVSFGILGLICYMSVFYCVIIVVSELIKKYSNINKSINKFISEKEWVTNNFSKISFGIIILGWLPWLIAFYPGSLWYDMCYQLEQYYGNCEYGLHPYFSTIVMGLCMDFGKHLFNSNEIGMFTYILLQSIVCALAYNKVIVWLHKNNNDALSFAGLIFFSFFPAFGAYAQYGTKDIMTYGLFTFWVMYVVEVNEKINKKTEVSITLLSKIVISSLLCSLYRHEMIIICVVILLMICVKNAVRKNKKLCVNTIVSMFFIISLYGVFNNIVVPHLAGEGGAAAQEMAVPLRQIARFVYYHPELVSEDEYKDLQEIFAFDIDEINERYNPYLSDPLVFDYKRDNKVIWKVYFSFMKKSPITYLESIISSSFGYYSVVPKVPPTVHGAQTNGTPGERFSFYINLDPDLEFNMVKISYIEKWNQWRILLIIYAHMWREIPGISLLYSLGIYTWIFILLVYIFIKNRMFNDMILLLPTIMILGVCIVSPANDYLRYYMGIFPTLFMLGGCITNKS